MRNRFVLLADLPTIALAAFGAFTLRFDLFFLSYREEFPSFLIAALLVKPVVYYAFGMYRRYWRYGNIDDVLMIVLANAAASLTLGVVLAVGLFAGIVPGVSRTVVLIDGVLALMLSGGLRLSIRVVGENRGRTMERGAWPPAGAPTGGGSSSAPGMRARWWCASCSATRISAWRPWVSWTTTRPSSGNGSTACRCSARSRRWPRSPRSRASRK